MIVGVVDQSRGSFPWLLGHLWSLNGRQESRKRDVYDSMSRVNAATGLEGREMAAGGKEPETVANVFDRESASVSPQTITVDPPWTSIHTSSSMTIPFKCTSKQNHMAPEHGT